jgi:hypothetical protein
MTPVAGVQAPAVAVDPQIDIDRRWHAWVATGHAADARIYRRLRWMAWIIVGAGILSWPAWAPAVRP